VQDSIEQLTYALEDCPEILDEWFEIDVARCDRIMELALSAKPDYILLGGSGTITMASPELARKYALPSIARQSKLAKAAGVPTMLHSCGKSRVLVDMLAEETDVDLINPLEVPPMGDVDLAETKRARGRRMTLMGNLHTTDVMLRGTPELVKRRALEAMRDAGHGGGFILSTGDQCGRDTPDENLFALIETAKQYGIYDPNTGDLPAVEEALKPAGVGV
jgi:uroporphyrinogen decarboxylase